MTESTKSATLTIDGKDYELPIFSPSAGPDVIDIRKLYGQADVFTYDPGFTSTASCDSTITYIDGGEGILLHRGYPIDQLAGKSHYLEVCYLLLYGELPSPAELEDFESRVTNHTMIHEQMMYFVASAVMRTQWPSWSALSAQCRPSTTTARTFLMNGSAKWRRFA